MKLDLIEGVVITLSATTAKLMVFKLVTAAAKKLGDD